MAITQRSGKQKKQAEPWEEAAGGAPPRGMLASAVFQERLSFVSPLSLQKMERLGFRPRRPALAQARIASRVIKIVFPQAALRPFCPNSFFLQEGLFPKTPHVSGALPFENAFIGPYYLHDKV